MTKYFLIAIVILGLVLTGSAAQAQDRYFCPETGNSGDWDVAANWEGDAGCTDDDYRIPDRDDWVLIPSGKTCSINSQAVADIIDVESTGSVQIGSNVAVYSLTLDDDSARGSTINGIISLVGQYSLLAFIDNDQTIDGTGWIQGLHYGAKITISANETLTNETEIRGTLQIDDATISGTFVNSGTVHARSNGILEIKTDAFDDEEGALWKVSTILSAVLKFNVPGSIVTLDGDFVLDDDATIEMVSPSFQTTGSLDWTGGTIEVNQSEAVTFGYVAP